MRIIESIPRYYRTIIHLRFRQLYFQVWYRIINTVSKKTVKSLAAVKSYQLSLESSIPNYSSFDNGTFTFLNLSKSFDGSVDWNYSAFGKLWAYNLNYFDFLNQPNIKKSESISLLKDFCAAFAHLQSGREPYPISLRGINWIKFFTYTNTQEREFDQILFADYSHLAKRLEYHLMGNHLLENGFSLMYGAYYFRNERFYRLATDILNKELKEQILEDGAHFELSPMYHQIILLRILDCINLIKSNKWHGSATVPLLKNSAGRMLGWLHAVSFSNGMFPMVNDCAHQIAPPSAELFKYASQLGVQKLEVQLKESGYRMIRNSNFELFLDIGKIGPDYIPGHAHSDTLSFLLCYYGKSIIVDTGTSTYENNQRRLLERSTESHNTVMIGHYQQSEVWGSFRVGRRAKIIRSVEGHESISATHDGYGDIGVYHTRTWTWGDSSIVIEDMLRCLDNVQQAFAFFHFSPDVIVSQIDTNSLNVGGLRFSFEGALGFKFEKCYVAAGFNKLTDAQKLVINFSERLITKISPH